jgi:hypothetical protein
MPHVPNLGSSLLTEVIAMDVDARPFRARTRVVARRPRPDACAILIAACLIFAAALFAGVRAHARADAPPSGSTECNGAAGRTQPHSFLGRPCRNTGCDSHKAGFAWADRGGITNAGDCLGAEDPGFAEGCRAFVEDAVTAENAGFQWARENDVDEPCRCGGAGPRFEAGCEVYVRTVGR